MQDMSLAETITRPVITGVVDQFYSRIQSHATLAAPFAKVVDWPVHKERLAYFWWLTLGGTRDRDYQYHVSHKHFEHGFTRALLADWLQLFETTVRELLPTAQADSWLALAQRMGEGLAVTNDQMHACPKGTPHDFADPRTSAAR